MVEELFWVIVEASEDMEPGLRSLRIIRPNKPRGVLVGP